MSEFAVTGMTCNACLGRVRSVLETVAPGSTVTLDPPRATFPASRLAAANEALTAVGKYRISALGRATAPGGMADTAWPDVASSGARSGSLASLVPYRPLALVLGLIAVAAFAGESWMMAFMAGFYIVFGAFKLLDIPAFADAYRRYDIVAERLPVWGYIYPFVELALGFAFLFWVFMGPATWIALILGLIGAAGVIRSVRRGETIQCACLGTVFNLPMSTITVVENLGMAAMAAWMLIVGMDMPMAMPM